MTLFSEPLREDVPMDSMGNNIQICADCFQADYVPDGENNYVQSVTIFEGNAVCRAHLIRRKHQKERA